MNSARRTGAGMAVVAALLAASGTTCAGQSCVPAFDFGPPSIGNPGFRMGFDPGNMKALVAYNDGTGEKLYAGGTFDTVGLTPTAGIAVWNGAQWNPVGSGVFGNTGALAAHVSAMTVWDRGSGPELYAAGGFRFVGGVAANSIARWNGTQWSALGDGVKSGATGLGPTTVHDLQVFNNELYVAGSFTYAGGVRIDDSGANQGGIAKWNGTQWVMLQSGLPGNVNAVEVFDDGTGPAIYAAGNFFFFDDNDHRVNGLARWNGSAWVSVGNGNYPGLAEGVLPQFEDLKVFDDGTGQKLYAISSQIIVRWNGTAFEQLAAPASNPRTLEIFDAGGGPALYAAGAAGLIERWTGGGWERLIPVAFPIDNRLGGPVNDLLAFAINDEPMLFVVGEFGTVNVLHDDPAVLSNGIAAIRLCEPEPSCSADFNGDSARDVADLFAYINAWLAKTPNADFNDDAAVDVADLFAYINAWLAGC